VVLARGGALATSVSYGGQALTLRRDRAIYNRRFQVWTGAVVGTRRDDIVRTAGIAAGVNVYLASTVLHARAVAYAGVADDGGWAGWTPGIRTLSLSGDRSAEHAIISVACGEGSDFAASLGPFGGDGQWLSSGVPDPGSGGVATGCAQVIRLGRGAPTLGGFVVRVDSPARFQSAVLLDLR
jgi:hypothetical protein